jgi:hypothetical protein
MRERYKDQVEFLAIYVREAHPTDGWREPGNDAVGIAFAQPRDSHERGDVAGKCCATLELKMPLLVDAVNDRVGHAYSGMPDRLYLIDRQGKVAYKGGRGPWGFKPGEMEQALIMLLLEQEGPKAAPQENKGDASIYRRHLPPRVAVSGADRAAGSSTANPAALRPLPPTRPGHTDCRAPLPVLW